MRSENYNLFFKDDYLKTELASVESFESVDLNSIPISPSLAYTNLINFKNYSFINEFDFTLLKRNESTTSNPSDSYKININNEIFNDHHFKNLLFNNKIIFNNSYSDYRFNKNQSLDHKSLKSNIKLSSDLYYQNLAYLTPRLKL